MLTAVLLAAWSTTVAGAHATAWFRARRRASPRPPTGLVPRALLLRPLSGAEPALRTCLARTGGVPTVVFCVGSSDDAAHPVALAAARDLTRTGVQATVTCTAALGPNHKVDQLAIALERHPEPCDVVVVCDSDVRLDAGSLQAALLRFQDPALGMVWFAPVATSSRSCGDRSAQAVLSGSLHAFPLLAGIDPRGVVGKLLLVRRSALEPVGGFASLRHHLGEDMELGLRVRAAGWRIERAEEPVRAVGRAVSFVDAVERFARWITVIRTQRPGLLWSYPLILGASTPALASTSIAAWRWPMLVMPAAFLLLARMLVWQRARAYARLPIAPSAFLFDVVVADLVLWLAFVRALGSRRLRWRGRDLVFGPARRLQG